MTYLCFSWDTFRSFKYFNAHGKKREKKITVPLNSSYEGLSLDLPTGFVSKKAIVALKMRANILLCRFSPALTDKWKNKRALASEKQRAARIRLA